MSFSAIEFVGDQLFVEVVPDCWIINEKVYWPNNFTKETMRHLKACQAPELEWPLYEAKIIKSSLSYLEAEALLARKFTNRNRRTDDEDEHSDLEDTSINNKPPPKLPSVPSSFILSKDKNNNSNQSRKRSIQGPDLENIRKDNIPLSKKQRDHLGQIDTAISPNPSTSKKQRDHLCQIDTANSPNPSTSKSAESDSDLIEILPSSNLSEKSTDEKKNTVKSNNEVLLRTMLDIRDSQLRIEVMLKRLCDGKQLIEDVDFEGIPSFPLQDEEGLQTMEKELESKANRVKVAEYFKTLGGENVKKAAQAILKVSIGDNLASKFSLKGAKGKNSFEQLTLFKVIKASILKKYQSDETEFRKFVGEWLKRGPARIQLRENRQGSKSSTSKKSHIYSGSSSEEEETEKQK